ncbi:MAG: hypothetical protein R3272_14210 [Candidatus Promineifilaceae bacterium]|nr:hypothetical protein [Candidatus Promineifilaceae bacterium]
MDEDLDRDQLQKDIHELYAREHAELGEAGTLAHLERGEQWDLSDTLREGGVLVFPHAGVKDCGYQIAACVQACLDSGAERVVVISVLHAFTHEMELARRRVAAGGDPADEPFWGIQGPGIDGRQEWRGDHALMSWRHFWKAEVRRRGLADAQVPQVIERYPYLAGGRPGALPGIEALARVVEDAVVVSTADPFHHGIGYGTPPEEAFPPDEAGLAKARAVIEEGIAILERGDYWAYNQHCVAAKSDARDAGQVFRYLRGPLRGRVLDITYSDTAGLYNAPPPTWVAAPLVEWRPA